MQVVNELQRERDGLWKELVTVREAMAQAVRNEGDSRACEAEAMASRDNDLKELTQVRNCWTRFREWVHTVMLTLLKIFDSIFRKRDVTSAANPRLLITH